MKPKTIHYCDLSSFTPYFIAAFWEGNNIVLESIEFNRLTQTWKIQEIGRY